jgi:hypothetical protein
MLNTRVEYGHMLVAFIWFFLKPTLKVGLIRRSRMASSERKRVFRKARGTEEEKKLLESSIPVSTRRSTRWAFNIFKEWQMTRGNKTPV